MSEAAHAIERRATAEKLRQAACAAMAAADLLDPPLEPTGSWMRRASLARALGVSERTISRHARAIGAEKYFGRLAYVDEAAVKKTFMSEVVSFRAPTRSRKVSGERNCHE